jgi:hypothetical protein
MSPIRVTAAVEKCMAILRMKKSGGDKQGAETWS